MLIIEQLKEYTALSAAEKAVKYGYIMSAGVSGGFDNVLKIKL